jgi:hypothetical protein
VIEMAGEELSVSQAEKLLLDWAKTLVNKVEFLTRVDRERLGGDRYEPFREKAKREARSELSSLMEEVNGAFNALTGAMQRERFPEPEAWKRPGSGN